MTIEQGPAAGQLPQRASDVALVRHHAQAGVFGQLASRRLTARAD